MFLYSLSVTGPLRVASWKKKSSKNECGCDSTPDLLSVSEVESLGRIYHGHDASTSTLARNANAQVSRFSLSMASTCR
ncbi:hypothetical protein AVEN_73797-1 [Araneus ventricosus]|uniref:Uncharacterized protein n=1 Tax=Araneus ventricosus TaxID=182803 RepID=A0A4Y2HE00_ARAVE|nr:hypothetical protein AVEN_73797-1 [Araneus ventricosus]